MFGSNIDAIEARVQQIMPAAGTIQQFRFFVQITPSAGTSWTLTVRKNGADTAVTCTITSAGPSCSDTTNTAVFAAGDLISVGVVSSGAPPSTPGRWTAQFAP